MIKVLDLKKLFALAMASMLMLTGYAENENNAAAANQPSNKIELLKNELFKPACFFITVGKDPYIKIVKPDTTEIKTIKCGSLKNNCTTKVAKAADLENLSPLRLTVLNYSANTKLDVRYRGDRDALVGKALERIFLPAEKYNGTPLVDEYKANIPMFWLLNSVEEFKATENYFSKKIEQDFVPTQKPLLVLKFNNGATTDSLDQADKDFIGKYFTLIDLTNPDVKRFFEDAMETIVDEGFAMGTSDPLYVGETAIQSIFRQVEKNYKKFDTKDIAITTGVMLLGTLVITQICDEINAIRKYAVGKATQRKDGNNKVIPGTAKTTFFEGGIDRLENCCFKEKPQVATAK